MEEEGRQGQLRAYGGGWATSQTLGHRDREILALAHLLNTCNLPPSHRTAATDPHVMLGGEWPRNIANMASQ